MSSRKDKHQVGGTFSISQDLKNSIANEQISESGEGEMDVLQKRMQERAVYNREDDYHKQRLGNKNDKKSLKRGIENGDSLNRESKELIKRQRHSNNTIQTYTIPQDTRADFEDMKDLEEIPEGQDLRYFKPSDKLHFALVVNNDTTDELSPEDQKKRRYLQLLLRIKNGSTQVRRESTKQLVDKCETFGPQLVFDCTLPILLDRDLEDQERHLLIKLTDRLLYKFGQAAAPFSKNILDIMGPLLIDTDPLVRSTGREVITNLASATGLLSMLKAIRPDMETEDEYARNIAARVLAVIARPLGIRDIISFINAACHSRNSWRSRHTGIKAIGQLSLTLGISQLPFLNSMLHCIVDGLEDEHVPIRSLTANTIATLAENSFPYGIESFNIILEPLWKGLKRHRGRILASFVKCLASIIPLMDAEYAGYYTEELFRIIKREFNSPDEDLKKAVLVVLQKCCPVETVTPKYLREEIGPMFFKNYWNRRVALDKQMNKLVTYTTVIISEKMGSAYIVEQLLGPLRDDSEPFRIMAIHTVDRVIKAVGSVELNERLETRLIDALLIAFQDQKNDDQVIFKCIGTVATSLGIRMKPFLSPIISTILNQLKHKDTIVRQNAADLCNILIPVLKTCGEEDMVNKLNIILYESLGEAYPDVLGSIIRVMSTIIATMDIATIQPPVNQILPTLTPILRNNHKKVQLYTVEMIGRIASRAPEFVAPKEWLRICFQLLELLKSPNKKTRIAANATFGDIAKAVGPQDVIVVLLDNLKVQERQLRVCTAVAIGIVAKVCGPFTVLPAMMNEYKTPDTNVQNGILKAMTFMFEYIGSISQDYTYITVPLLEDALIDRDLVHRQTAATVVKEIALHSIGSAHEDAFIHLLNLLIPNIFETSPHVISRILEGLEALCYAVGPGIFMNYVWAGLFHPARTVRRAYWKLYNTVYIEHCDALVPNYPSLPDKEDTIEELDWIL